ncbi:hypothetical protein [Coleofasciculus sp. G2-EDA-02]
MLRLLAGADGDAVGAGFTDNVMLMSDSLTKPALLKGFCWRMLLA